MTGTSTQDGPVELEAAPSELSVLVARARDLVERLGDAASSIDALGRPALIGVAGAPGVGKSSLTGALGAALRGYGLRVAVVPMDGFHLSRRATEALGRLDRRGAPDTFDADGYLSLLRRVRDVRTVGRDVWAPSFEREIHDPVAGEIPVRPDVDLVLTEGNYLLLDEEPWSEIAGLLDEAWFLQADDESARVDRLISRHVRFGKDPDHARRHVATSDEVNAALIATTAGRADVLIEWRTAAQG